MKKTILACALALWPMTLIAQDTSAINADIVENHILPRIATLSATGAALADAARDDCTTPALDAPYGAAFDAWIAVSHLRCGPIEADERGFALAFWPDSRGATPKALGTLIRDEDPIADNADAYQDMSIAARGYYALEFLLYDDTIRAAGEDAYRCQLVTTIAADIGRLTQAVAVDWQSYAARLTTPMPEGTYRTDTEATQELFKALTTGLQLTSDARLGRPLGSFDNPRPKRAEAWRSGRSAHHVRVALDSLQDLALRLSAGNPALLMQVEAAFTRARDQLSALDDPIFAGVASPADRIKVEALRTRVEEIRAIAGLEIGPALGVAAGFNSLDGD